MLKNIVTISTVVLFATYLISEQIELKKVAIELKSSVKTFEELNKKYSDILNKDIYVVSKDDFESFKINGIMKLKNEYKKEVEKEIDNEVKLLEEKYKNIDFNNIEDIENIDIDSVNVEINKLSKNENIEILLEKNNIK